MHDKALAHLSRGLYRSPASAIRELVSNGWDAKAKNVYIDTNFPNFFQLSIRDDGNGFSKDEFTRLMSGNIGNSQKRTKAEAASHRPTIGRLGIGMLGIAQICGAFTISSKPVDEDGNPLDDEGFSAEVRLYDLLKDDLDKDSAERTRTVSSSEGDVRIVEVGTFRFLPFDAESFDRGTVIVTNDIHPTFTKSFRDSVTKDFLQPERDDWGHMVKQTATVRSLQELGDYWKFVWELAASCPIPYASADAIPGGLVKADQKRLLGYDFNVHIDGITLRKPTILRDNPEGYSSRTIDTEAQIYGRKLKYHGYILVQEGCQIRPDELRGIMIRIKDVAIGYYDPSLLDYRINHGPRNRWFTGEIFVTEGLEDALNIDRDSFNKFHPQYRAIQDYVHSIFNTGLFTEVYQKIEARSKRKKAAKSKQRSVHVQSIFQGHLGADAEVRFGSKDSESEESGTEIKEGRRGDVTEVVLPAPDSLDTKKTNRELASTILGIFEVAMRESKTDARRVRFKELLLEALKKW